MLLGCLLCARLWPQQFSPANSSYSPRFCYGTASKQISNQILQQELAKELSWCQPARRWCSLVESNWLTSEPIFSSPMQFTPPRFMLSLLDLGCKALHWPSLTSLISSSIILFISNSHASLEMLVSAPQRKSSGLHKHEKKIPCRLNALKSPAVKKCVYFY